MSLLFKAIAKKEHRSDYNPLQVLRATNALQSLGKENALQTLENVIQLQEQYPNLFDDPQFFWILAMLFEPIRFGGEIREPFIPFDFVRLREEWPTNPIEVVEGIPILITSGGQWVFAGKRIDRGDYLDRIQRDCVLRDAPLIPTMDPVLAIDIFEKSQKVAISSSNLSNVQDSLRAQAASTLPDDHPLRAGYLSKQVSWSELVEFSRKSPVVWDRQTETFQLSKLVETDKPRD